MEIADGGGDGRGFANGGTGKFGLDLENGVDALGRQVQAHVEGEERRGVETVEDDQVELAGAAAERIEDEGGRGAVALGEVALEQLTPLMFGSGSGSGGVLDQTDSGELGEHLVLDAAKDFGEIDVPGIGSAWHI